MVGAAAVIGAVVDIDLLREVLPDLSEADVLDAIDVLLPRRVFRETGNAGRVEFVHDLLRELPYADLSATRRRSLHRRVGELLEERRAKGQAVAAAVLADHFRNAEDRSKAFAYTMEAAEAALDAYAFNNAIAQLNEAQSSCPDDADDATRYRLWDMLGTAYGSSGRLDDAIAAYTQALEHAGDGIARATAHHGIGEAYHRKGDFDDAVRHFDLALREVGYPRPRSRAGTPLRHLADLRLLPHAPVLAPSAGRRARPRPADRDRVRDLLSASARSMRQRQPPQLYSWLVQARRPREAVGEARALRRGLFQVRPQLRHVLAASARDAATSVAAEKAAESCPRDEVRAVARAHVGMRPLLQRPARRTPRPSSARPSDTSTRSATGSGMFSHHFLRHIYAVRGDIPRELAEAETEIAIGTARGDAETLAWGQYGKADALARAGRIDEAQDLADPRGRVDRRPRARLTLAVAHWRPRLRPPPGVGLRRGARGTRAIPAIGHPDTSSSSSSSAPPFRSSSRACSAPAGPSADGGPSRAVARKAWRESRFARFIGWRFPNYGPHALRVSGRAAFALGKTKKAAQLPRAIDRRGREARRPLRPRPRPARRLARHPRKGRRIPPPRPAVARRARRRRPRGRATGPYRLRAPVIRTSQRTREGARRLFHAYRRTKNGAKTSRRGLAATRAIRRPHSSVVSLRIVLAIVGSFSRVPGL